MALFTLVHIKRHGIIPMNTRKQRDTPQSSHHGGVRHAESGCAEIIHVDNDVTVFVLGRIQGQERVFSLVEDFVENGCDAFDDAKVKLGLRDHLGEPGEDEASLGAGDFEINVVTE